MAGAELRQPDGATDAWRRRATPSYHYVRPRCVMSPLASTTNGGTARRVCPHARRIRHLRQQLRWK